MVLTPEKKRQRRKEIQVIVLREWKQKLTIIIERQYSLGVIQAHILINSI